MQYANSYNKVAVKSVRNSLRVFRVILSGAYEGRLLDLLLLLH